MKVYITIVVFFIFCVSYAQTDTLINTKKDTAVINNIVIDSNKTVSINKDTGYIKVIITGITSGKKGWLFAGLYYSKAFLKKDPFRKYAAEVTSGQITFRFDSVPKGYYAVAAIHDINKDEKLNVNNIGVPTEGFGFSNNAFGNLGPPVFIDCRFYFNGKSKTLNIKMTYMFNK